MHESKLDTTRTFDTFVVPPAQNIYEKYTFRAEKKENRPGTWNSTVVTVELHHEDGSVEDIFEYERNYSMYKTFEPFRQFKDGAWHEYALISTRYTRFEVLDLEKREIIAVEPYPTITEEIHARWRAAGYADLCEKEPVGTEKPGAGFCPVEFYVPDWAENKDENSPYLLNYKEDGFLYDEDDLLDRTGQFALYMGCIWGDDSGGWNIRYIDLSRISEGVVTSDERFGYISFAGKSLKEIDVWEEGRMVIPVEMVVDASTGKAFKIEANWSDEDED